MLIYLWVGAEPYGLDSLKTHKGFRIKATGIWQIHFVFQEIEQGCLVVPWLLSAYRVQKLCLVIHTHDFTSSSWHPNSRLCFLLGLGRGTEAAWVQSPEEHRNLGNVGKSWSLGFVPPWQLLKQDGTWTWGLQISWPAQVAEDQWHLLFLAGAMSADHPRVRASPCLLGTLSRAILQSHVLPMTLLWHNFPRGSQLLKHPEEV